jgi:hypothetical protein
MAHVLLMAAGEFRDPVPCVVLMESDDPRRSHRFATAQTRHATCDAEYLDSARRLGTPTERREASAFVAATVLWRPSPACFARHSPPQAAF